MLWPEVLTNWRTNCNREHTATRSFISFAIFHAQFPDDGHLQQMGRPFISSLCPSVRPSVEMNWVFWGKGFSYNDSETIVDQGHQQVKFCTSLNSFDAVVVKKVMVKPQKWPLFWVRKTWPSYPTSTLSYSRFCWASFCLHLGLDLEITKLSISGSSSSSSV